MVRNHNLIHSWHSDTQHTHEISGESVNHSWRNFAICRQTDTHTHIQQLMSYSWCPQQGTFQYNFRTMSYACCRASDSAWLILRITLLRIIEHFDIWHDAGRRVKMFVYAALFRCPTRAYRHRNDRRAYSMQLCCVALRFSMQVINE